MVIRIYICGNLAIEDEQQTLDESAFPARQGRRLWSYLVLRRRGPVSREALGTAIWGDDPPEGSASAVNALVSRLRTTIRPFTERNPDFRIVGETGRYRLMTPPGTIIDFDRARLALHSAEAANRVGDLDLVLSESRVAIEIATRPFLDGEHGVWITGERNALAHVRLHAFDLTVLAELARGNPDIAEREAETLVALDPLRESSYRLLMRVLQERGNPAQAIRVMERLREVLHQHGGLAPSAETELALQAVLSGNQPAPAPSRERRSGPGSEV